MMYGVGLLAGFRVGQGRHVQDIDFVVDMLRGRVAEKCLRGAD